MKHTESDVKVFVTTDYKIFNRIRGNRSLNMQKVKKIVRDIKNENDLLADFPILVTPPGGGIKLDVTDGQHRLEAAIQTKKPVYYIVRKEELSLEKMARFNSLQEKWKPKDFINCYIEKGIADYKKLSAFIEDYGVPVSVALNLLYFGVTGGDTGAGEDVSEMFRRGDFRVKHMKQAVEIIEECKKFGEFTGWNTRPFIVTISKILGADQCDLDELVEKFKAEPRQLQRHGNSKAYLTNLEQIYNKGYHKRRTIF
ncbi:MAG: ParB N-terminal domain-containing protein [Chitinophagaceae bacterium]